MSVVSADFPTQPQEGFGGARGIWGRWDTRYKIAPGLELVASARGGTLFSLRPLMAMRLNTVGTALLSGLSVSEGCTAAELAARVPDLSPMEAEAFLDGLVPRRLIVREPASPTQWPSVCVIVAAYGRPTATRACVRSLLSLDYPSDQVEIVVVDDASDPPLAPVLADLPVRLLRLECNVGQSAARNFAAAQAESELLAFTDNDCVAASDWLRNLVPYFHDPEIVIVGGRVVAPPPTGRVAAFEAVRSPLDMGLVNGPVGPREAVTYLPTCNLIVRRDVLLAIGGFTNRMRLGEDVDFVWRVLRDGGRAYYATAGEIIHDHRVQLVTLLRRRADYGFSEADLKLRHPENEAIMHLPRAGLLALVSLPLSAVSWTAGTALALLALAIVSVELVSKSRRLRRLDLAVPTRRLVASMLREHAASLYHLGRYVTRYYGLPLVGASALWPPLIPLAAILILVPPIWDHQRFKPALSLPAFVALYWLEMAAYQLGVWRGCLARRCWRPLLPLIRWRP